MKQVKAVRVLLAGSSLQETAQQLKINSSSLYRWTKLPAFKDAILEGKRELVGDGILQLQRRFNDAVDTLAGIMENTESPANARVTAAKSIIEQSFKGLEFEDLIARIERLEELASCNQQQDE